MIGHKANHVRPSRSTKKARPSFAVEALEDRYVPSTLQILNGVLTYNASAGIANNVKIAISGDNYVISDTAETISAPGLSGSGTHSIAAPTGFVGSMVFNLFDQNDTLVVESTVSPIAVNAGDGNDTIDLGKFVGGTLGGLQADVTVDGGVGTDNLRINNPASSLGGVYTVTPTQVLATLSCRVSYAGAERLSLAAGAQNDTFFLRGTAAGTTTTINGGNGADTFNVGNAINTLDDVKGTLVLLGGATDNRPDSTNLFDQGSSVSNSYVVRDTSVTRSGGVAIVYREMEQLTLSAGTAADGLVVGSTVAGTPVTLNMGGGNDVIDIATRTGTSLDLISAPVTLNGEGGTDRVSLNDQMDTNANSYVLSSTDVTRNGLQILSYANVEGLTLNAGAFDDAAAVQSTLAATPVTLKMGAGRDTVTVGSAGGSLDPILGGVSVDGQADVDVLTINDGGDADFNFYTVTATNVTRLGGPPLAYAGTESLFVNGSAGIPFDDFGLDFFLVKSTSAATTLNASFFIHTSFSIGNNAGSLDDIRGPLTLNTAGLGDITLFDDAETVGNSYTVTDHSVDRAGAALISYGPENSLLLFTGSGSDTVSVTSTFSTPVEVDLGAGNDTLTVGGGFNALDAISLPVTVFGEADSDTVILDDQAPAVGSNDYRITSTDVTRNGREILNYSQIESLILEAGFGSNTIHLLSSAATTPVSVRGGQDSDTFKFDGVNANDLAGSVTVDGQGGTNTLDYSAYFFPTTVRVNLALGTATGVAGGVSNVENVIGGPGDDILIGNDQADVLTGGPGRDILIGRGGADVLNGGVGDDILIGCSTDYDFDSAALENIMAEWGRTDLEGTPGNQYFGRIQHLLGKLAGGENGSTFLTLSHLSDDGAADTLNGGSDLDWFFKLGSDTLPDRSLNERVN
jgi:Ca2+-binding RTX toxin-like protein